MRVLAFRHVPFEGLGWIARSLEAAAIEYEYVDLFRTGVEAPDVDDAAALVFMGGPQSANDDFAYIRGEIDLIRRAVDRGKPVLGVCLGSQLIAAALGARVYRNPVKEIGWYPVYWTDACGRDALFRGLAGPELIFHWHGETFDLPAGAELLAASDACRHQAFRAGDNVYGLQFHLEVTPAMIQDWCEQDANSGDVRELGAPIDSDANAARLSELSALVFGRWVASLNPRS